MYTLVQFHEDHIYYICQTSSLRKKKKGIEAKWMDGRYYPANAITYHENRPLLESIVNNLCHNYPVILLSQLSTNAPVRGKLTPIESTIQQSCPINLEVVSALPQGENFEFATDCVVNKNNYELNQPSSSVENETPSPGQISATDIDKCHLKNSIFNKVEHEVVLRDAITEHNYAFDETTSSVNVEASDSAIETSHQSHFQDLDIEMENEAIIIDITDENLTVFDPVHTTYGTEATINQMSDTVMENEAIIVDITDENLTVFDPVHTTYGTEATINQMSDTVMENEAIIVDITDENLTVFDPVHTTYGTEATINQMSDTAIEASHQSHCNNSDEFIILATETSTLLRDQFGEIEHEVLLDNVTDGNNNYELCSFENVASKQLNDSAIETVVQEANFTDSVIEMEDNFLDMHKTRRRLDYNSDPSMCVRNPKPQRSPYVFYDRTQVVLPLDASDCNNETVRELAVDSVQEKKPRKYFCIYCKHLYTKFPQHLMVSHKTEPAVIQLMSLPAGSVDRRRLIETIRKKGDFIYNTEPGYNTGNFYVARRPLAYDHQSNDYLPCHSCKGFFRKSTLRIHFKKCARESNSGRSAVVLGRSISRQIHAKACFTLRTRIFPVLREDACVSIIRYDYLAITLANYWCSLYADPHYDEMIRARLRLIGRLLIATKTIDSTVTDFSSLITPSKYDVVITAINKVAGLNEMGTVYKAPTTATTLATICKKAADIWHIECLKLNNKQRKKEAQDFLSLFKFSSSAAIHRTALENRIVHQRHKVVTLPSKDDITKLVAYLRINRRRYFRELNGQNENTVSFDTWKQLASFTLVSVMVFNRRRAGELERITIEDYASLHSIDSTNCKVDKLSVEDTRLAQRYKRFEIRGKLNRVVPVLINWELQTCLDIIIRFRNQVGVPSSNPYVFGLPTNDNRNRYLRACVLIREYANQCGALNPNLLRGTQLRKHIATECSLQDLSENIVRDVAHFMGHDKNIHDNIYRLPVNTRDILQMSKVLEMVQGKTNSGAGSDENDDSDSDTEINHTSMQDTDLNDTSMQDTALNDTPMQDTDLNDTIDTTPVSTVSTASDCIKSTPKKNSKRRHRIGLTRICGNKIPWSDQEKDAALQNFGTYLEKRKLPSSAELSDALPNIPQLERRTVHAIKTWLENELKRRQICLSSTKTDKGIFLRYCWMSGSIKNARPKNFVYKSFQRNNVQQYYFFYCEVI
ncbi:hypothetical protein RI129_002867 [Pyrocoelia pectoralis]|uniref:Uncharacterized protein n=1 Tax=Pyrocoelia pectoralis TaxID=417401 RepID=A0AAN7ZI84_9COLE